MKRRDVKDRHEVSVLDSFKQHLKTEEGRSLSIIDRPDPPDAMVFLDNNQTWIEVTDAILNAEYARSITSYPAEDVAHVPCENKKIQDSDDIFTEEVINVVSKKYAKATLRNIYIANGPGILLVGLYSPFVSVIDINELQKEVSVLSKNKDGRFKDVYLYDMDHTFYKVY